MSAFADAMAALAAEDTLPNWAWHCTNVGSERPVVRVISRTEVALRFGSMTFHQVTAFREEIAERLKLELIPKVVL